MAQKHTWNFYLTAGRTWGGPRISGASITAYSTKTGPLELQTLTTDINGYATYTISGSSISPASYFWRVNIGNVFGNYYQRKNIIAKGDTSGCYSMPSESFNTEGVAIISSTFSPNYVNSVASITVYFFIVGNDVAFPNDKALTNFDLISLVPPEICYLSTYPGEMTLNKCVTWDDLQDYVDDHAFKDYQSAYLEELVSKTQIQEWSKYYTKNQVSAFTLSTTSLAFEHYEYGSTNGKSVTGTCSEYCYPYIIFNSGGSSHFDFVITSISKNNGIHSYKITIYPTRANYESKNRVVNVTVGVKGDGIGYVNSSFLPSGGTITLTQYYAAATPPSGGTT